MINDWDLYLDDYDNDDDDGDNSVNKLYDEELHDMTRFMMAREG